MTYFSQTSHRFITALAAVFIALAVGGCVSTRTTAFPSAGTDEEALSAQVQLARSYMAKGNWEHAKRKLRIAHQMSPDAPEVHEAMALVSQSTGEYELAEYHYKRALAIQSDFPRARNNFAAFLYSQERYPEACDQLDKVVVNPLYESRAQAFYNLALCRKRLGDIKAAEKALQRVVAMDINHNAATLELAQLYFDRSELPLAAEYYGLHRSTVRVQSARALWLGIRIAHGLGDTDSIASYVLALRNLYPDSAELARYEETYGGR